MSERAEVTIDSIAAGGAGVGRLDGMAVFVPRTAPGDRVEISLRRQKRYGEGRVLRVLEPGAGRVEPRCQHYITDACGGCQLQHLDYPAQLEAKHGIVTQALRRIGRRSVAVHAPVPSPAVWEYRNKLTLALRRGPQGWLAGMRPWHDPDHVFPLTECPITRPEVLATWREVVAAADHFPDAESLRGSVRANAEGASLYLDGGDRWDDAERFVQRCPAVTRIVWRDARGRTREVLRTTAEATGAESFEQVNVELAPALHAMAARMALEGAPRSVVDAYGGTGAIASRLVGAGRRVTLIELDRDSAQVAARRLGDDARVVHGRVETALPDTLPADVVVLNPPRSGLDAAVCAELQRRVGDVGRIVYVSCDPATLARDLGRLTAWRVRDATPFDMFPQTAHVETVCVLEPEAA